MSLGYSASTEGSKETHSIKNWNFKSFGIKLINTRIYKPHSVSINTVPTWFPDDHRSLSRCNNYCKKINLEVSGSVFIFADHGYMSVKRCREIKKEMSIKAQVARNPREFSYKEIKIAINDFDSGRIIGQGSFRTVYNTCGARPHEAMDKNIAWYTYLKAHLWQDCRKKSEIDSWLSKRQYYSSPAGKLWESENENACSQHMKYSSNYEQATDKNTACYTNLNTRLWQDSRQQSEIDSWQSKNHYISPAEKLWESKESENEIAAAAAMDKNYAWYTNFNAQIWQDSRLQSEIDSWQSKKRYYSSPAWESEESENEIEEPAWSQKQAAAAAMDKNTQLWQDSRQQSEIVSWQSPKHYSSPAGKLWERSIASSSSQISNPELTCVQNEEDTSSNEVNQKPLTRDKVDQKPKTQQKQKQVFKGNQIWSLKAAEIAKRLEQEKEVQRDIRKEAFKRELEKKRIENALELQLNLINMRYEVKKKEEHRNCILQKNQRLNFQRKNAAAIARKSEKIIKQKATSIHGKSALKVRVGRVKLTSQENSYDISPYEYLPTGRKFVPPWASENRVAMTLPLQQELNPESIFCVNSFCNIDEVLPQCENQPLINDYGNPIDL
ncbi:hypothetical protein L1987_05828 [Smallanthus sonchifolius]|uniref:Uncharacterized protein n=1 Tax=Smallanthus sonchifolius TaxID=185202 RepID=A0ACB9JWF9_9ASTR|nr:hypothetical protein L1987_05828 [Smallanthus sonchifolius]